MYWNTNMYAVRTYRTQVHPVNSFKEKSKKQILKGERETKRVDMFHMFCLPIVQYDIVARLYNQKTARVVYRGTQILSGFSLMGKLHRINELQHEIDSGGQKVMSGFMENCTRPTKEKLLNLSGLKILS